MPSGESKCVDWGSAGDPTDSYLGSVDAHVDSRSDPNHLGPSYSHYPLNTFCEIGRPDHLQIAFKAQTNRFRVQEERFIT